MKHKPIAFIGDKVKLNNWTVIDEDTMLKPNEYWIIDISVTTLISNGTMYYEYLISDIEDGEGEYCGWVNTDSIEKVKNDIDFEDLNELF